MKNLILSFVFTVIALVSFGQDTLNVTSYNGDIDTLYGLSNYDNETMFTDGCAYHSSSTNEHCLDTIKIDVENKPELTDTLINFEDTIFNTAEQLSNHDFLIGLHDYDTDNHSYVEYNLDTVTVITFDDIDEHINIDSANVNDVGFYNITFTCRIGDSINDPNPTEVAIPFVIELYSSVASVDKEVQKVRNTKVYPNPVVDQMTIDFETDETNMPVEVYSTNGQKVYSNNESRMFGTNTVKVNMSNKPRGMYYVKIGGEVKKVVR